MIIFKDYIVKTLHSSIAQRFCNRFKIHHIFVTLCFCLASCEQYESFENDVFAANLPRGSHEDNLSKGFNGFTYNYIFTTPDNQEIGIEIIPWLVDLPKLINSFIDYQFPCKKQKSSYVDSSISLNSFKFGLTTGLDCEIYENDDLLDGWCYAFHTISGESVCVYTYAKSGQCRPIEKLIKSLKIKYFPKPKLSSLIVESDNLMASLLKQQYENSTIFFTDPTTLIRQNWILHPDGTECGIIVQMKDNMRNGPLGLRLTPSIQLNSYMKYIAKILNRNYLINFKYPDNSIEAPLTID